MNRQENKFYEQDYNNLVDDEEDYEEIDFDTIISREHRRLANSQFASRNAAKRSQEYRMDRFENTKAFKKISCIYFPVDKTQKPNGQIPQLLVTPVQLLQQFSFKR